MNPVARILALAIFTTPLLLTLDWVSATCAIAVTLVTATFIGGHRQLLRRGRPVFLAAVLATIPMALYGRAAGETYLSFGLITVTDQSLQLALAAGLRVIAVGLPVMVLSAGIDPTDLGDGLAQILHLPARFVIGSVAALRMLTLLRDDVTAMRRSRRSRGLADQGRIRYWFTITFGLLVMSLRRASKLAAAMEARGFGPGERTWARPSCLHRQDWALMGSAAMASALCLAASAATGHFALLGTF